jgi:hypothetical protein
LQAEKRENVLWQTGLRHSEKSLLLNSSQNE